MKRLLAALLLGVMILTLAACGGNVRNVKIPEYTSEVYTDQEIEAAIHVAVSYFQREFDGCTLTEITYAGDEKNEAYQEYAGRHDADDVIVLVSSFDVGPSGGDGSLNPNDTYTRWKWGLVRDRNGGWRHVDHGYG